eukprot:1094008-Pyramimonas_sp.AAC.1
MEPHGVLKQRSELPNRSCRWKTGPGVPRRRPPPHPPMDVLRYPLRFRWRPVDCLWNRIDVLMIPIDVCRNPMDCPSNPTDVLWGPI